MASNEIYARVPCANPFVSKMAIEMADALYPDMVLSVDERTLVYNVAVRVLMENNVDAIVRRNPLVMIAIGVAICIVVGICSEIVIQLLFR
jgi:hypothetical protein